MDLFPHAFQSQLVTTKETVRQPFSATIFTNFSLPGPETKRSSIGKARKQKDGNGPTGEMSNLDELKPLQLLPLQTNIKQVPREEPSPQEPVLKGQLASGVIRTKDSDGALNSKSYTTSLLSGASKGSRYRHPLLKPSVSEAEPVDTGLPIPPKLTPIDSFSGDIMFQEVPDSMPALNSNTLPANTDPLVESNQMQDLKFPSNNPVVESSQIQDLRLASNEKKAEMAASHLNKLQQTIDLLDNVRGQVQGVKQYVPISPPNGKVDTPVEKEPLSQLPAVNPVDAEYWGFVPAVKDAVQDAVQVVVQNAVSEVVVPPGVEKKDASQVYRRLMADSLSQAAKDADNYLKRPSIWVEPSLLQTAAIRPPPPAKQKEPTAHKLETLSEKSPSRPKGTPFVSGPVPERYANIGSTLINFDSQDNLNLTSRSLSPKDLEYTPLDMGQIVSPENHKQGENLSESGKNSSLAGYGVIPPRSSSKGHVLGSRIGGTNSPQRSPSKNVVINKRSYERLGPEKRRDLRSVSSVDSLRSTGSCGKYLGPDRPTRKLLDPSDDRSSASNIQFDGKLVRKNTVQWLRSLLSSNAPYEPRLTALPPRTRRGLSSSTKRGRSQTAPSHPVQSLYLGATPKPKDGRDATDISRADMRVMVPETFTRTIDDLEQLLNEAIIIARQAADNQNSAYMPAILDDAARILKNGRKEFSEEIAYNQALRASTRPRHSETMYSDEMSSIGSVHESLRSFSGDSSADFSDGAGYKHLTPYAGRSVDVLANRTRAKHDSGWPRIERSPTPFKASADLDYIKAADPHSQPIQVDFAATPRMSSEEPVPVEPLRCLSDSTPEFENVDPFNAPARTESARKMSEKSPRKLSPSKKSEVLRDDTGGDLGSVPLPTLTPRVSLSQNCLRRGYSEEDHEAVKAKLATKSVPGKREVRDYIENNRHPPIHPRDSSLGLRQNAEELQSNHEDFRVVSGKTYSWEDIDHSKIKPCSQNDSRNMNSSAYGRSRYMTSSARDQSILPCSISLDGSQPTDELDFSTGFVHRAASRDEPSRRPPYQENSKADPNADQSSREREAVELRDVPNPDLPTTNSRRRHGQRQQFSLRGKNHLSLRENYKGFSFSKSHKRLGIARDWRPARKRFCAAVACISTALVGILVGVYAGQVPAIQYYIVDFHHYTVLGNVFFFLGLAIPTFFFWPLPLLHGRKPYILGSMALAMPLLFPQALSVGQFRNPKVAYWRVALIMSRALMGFCLGFANMNFKSTLTDLFGASLQSESPHQEVVDENDVRRHGGGMGIWLGLWTWSQMGSIGLGFLIGAVIINHYPPSWGFYISIIIIAGVLLLNIITPEVRRAPFRKSVAEVRNGDQVSRRLARGEVKMHMVQTGPKWWGEECHYGAILTMKMLRQPGFLVIAIYVAWMYAQIVLIVILLGSLTSKYYKFKSTFVGLSVMSVPLGAMVAIPFQKASLFSRTRPQGPISDDDTYKKKASWSSHMFRRAIFILTLPFASLAYTLSSNGPPIPFILPILFAGLIGFLSNLAMAECHGILMETFDTSDLQPGQTGRARGSSGNKKAGKRINYSSFPRVASAFGITQGIGYMLASISTAIGGVAERHLGQKAATAVVAGILLLLSILLLGVLVRFKDVQIIPDSKMDEMSRWKNAQKTSAFRRAEGIEEDEPWRPVIIGNPTHHTRRMSVLEMGALTRWSEIRQKNHLVNQISLEAKRPDLTVTEDVKEKIKEMEEEMVHDIRGSVSRMSSRGSRQSDYENRNSRYAETGDLGGHREMISQSGNGTSRRRINTARPSNGVIPPKKGEGKREKGGEEIGMMMERWGYGREKEKEKGDVVVGITERKRRGREEEGEEEMNSPGYNGTNLRLYTYTSHNQHHKPPYHQPKNSADLLSRVFRLE
ncbi:hypothetical protein G7Y89_g1885 [Cudoniella acicularis]|uniref:Uncharacterized protein n=1 Tax=Cudoniella acicularis TaxID=354080 RepID=A0A8H4W7G5_9HELO|nr:hypothetical protein G7Y89_g1885 [Cudoniella acicularis]